MADTGAPPRAADARMPDSKVPDSKVPDSKVPDSKVAAEAGKRRAFAVISHPDAGKSTLTEALALHASAITQAGAVHGKAGRRGVTSDWMAMERARGISITSAALRFDYRDMVLNLLDTPGHADFSEDTYRVLSAVDGAVMLLDSAKGLEPQTLKLFDLVEQFQRFAARPVPLVHECDHRDAPALADVEQLQRLRLESLGRVEQHDRAVDRG